MIPNQLFLGVAIISLAIFLLNYLVVIENFESTPDASGKCPEKNWWDIEPVRTIISKQSGVHFPVHPVDPSLAIKSPVLIPISQKGSANASSCLYVNDDGTYSVAMCDSEISRHQWTIVVIQNQEDFKKILSAKPKQPGSLGDGSEKDYSDYEFGFCLVVSKHIPYKVLHYENNSLAIRDVGYYTGQQWYISPKKSQAGIAVKPIDSKSLFTPELNINRNQENNFTIGTNNYNPISSSYSNPIRPYLNNGNAVIEQPSETVFGGGSGGSPGGNGLNFRIVVDSNNQAIKDLLEPDTSTTSTPKVESFEDQGKETKKCKCNGCRPFDLSGYIKNKKIPCLGCNFQQ
jgi:hypothetical protein